jgi:hypothetical protein
MMLKYVVDPIFFIKADNILILLKKNILYQSMLYKQYHDVTLSKMMVIKPQLHHQMLINKVPQHQPCIPHKPLIIHQI